MTEAREEKRRLRKAALAARRAMTDAARRAESARIFAQLEAFAPYKMARCLLAYAAMPDEAQTDRLLADALAAGKIVCLPYVTDRGGAMEAAALAANGAMEAGAFGLATAAGAARRIVAPEEIDLVLAPGVAFDRAGRRLGMGAGFYDRFLARAPQSVVAALALDCQLVERVPAEPFDRSVDYLITAEGILDCGKKPSL